MNILSKNFELRCISHNKKANGETDFKGETSTLITEERVEFLNEYARQLSKMFNDFSLDEPVVTLEEAKKRLEKIKPQPVPQIRKRIVLDDWKWIGFDKNKKKSYAANNMKIPLQDFRCFIEWELTEKADYSHCVFALGEAAKMKIDGDGKPYYISNKAKIYIAKKAHILKIKFELDFVYRKWNLYLNDELMADFVNFSNPDTASVSEFVSPYAKSMIKRIWGVGYYRLTESDFEPYSINTFIDEDFQRAVNITGWKTVGYKDISWKSGTLPIVHGGERYAGQDIYMRKMVCIDEIPPYAELYIESLMPGGEVYINGRLAAFIKDPSCKKIDVTEYLTQGKNLIAVKVYFVGKGGTFIATYLTSYVDENDLCHIKGFPGYLMELFGIWNEEIDSIYEKNAIISNGREYEVTDYCERIHPYSETEILGVYKSDFYAGEPAVTKHAYGEGTAYYIAARTGQDYLKELYSNILVDNGLVPLAEKFNEESVSVVKRGDKIFIMNFSDKETKAEYSGEAIILKPYECVIKE